MNSTLLPALAGVVLLTGLGAPSAQEEVAERPMVSVESSSTHPSLSPRQYPDYLKDSRFLTMEDGTRVELTEIERDLFFTLLIIAGNETTRNAISKGMIAFFEHPDQWQRWLDRPELVDTMVDEILRWTSPVNFFRRTASETTELGGQTIEAGQKVLLWYPSGNRDERAFPDAGSFDIGRTPNHHMAFGAGGAHYCLGANLAKLEIRITFEELARRTPDIRLDGEVQRLRMNLVDGIKHMPVAFTPTPALL